MLLAAGLIFGGLLLGQAQKNRTGAAQTPGRKPAQKTQTVAKKSGEKKKVDFRAKDGRSASFDKNAMVMVDEVVFHHNGAVISCDSAVRYSDQHFEFFKNVIINKGDTYAYGERAVWNGSLNQAQLFSPVIKVIDGDATLYTYNFTYNTRTSVGTWFGGGVMYQKENIMESEKGYVYSDRNELVAVRNVEMKNKSHRLRSDSIRYNSDTKIATFFTRTYIWTKDNEIIAADRGRYNTNDSTYFFWRNAYILDEFRESWADTIDFNSKKNDAVFYGNIQIDDNEHESSAFGDYGRYWGDRGETMLTKRPSLLNYSTEGEGATGDTLYMRADTIFMFVRYPSDSPRKVGADGDGGDPNADLKWIDSLPDSLRLGLADSLAVILKRLRSEADSISGRVDSIMEALYPAPKSPLQSIMEGMPDSLKNSDSTALLGPLGRPDSLAQINARPDSSGGPSAKVEKSDDVKPGGLKQKKKRIPRRGASRSGADSGMPPGSSETNSGTAIEDRNGSPAGTRHDTMDHRDSLAHSVTGADGSAGTAADGLIGTHPETGSETEEFSPPPPAQTPEDARIEPEEVKLLKLRRMELDIKIDSLDRIERYARSKSGAVADPVADSLAKLQADSIRLARKAAYGDSLRTADPKAFKKWDKAERKREKARLKTEQKAEKNRLREEKWDVREQARAKKAAERDSVRRAKLMARNTRRGRPAWVDETRGRDSLSVLDSIRRLDSLEKLRLDSLERAGRRDSAGTAEPDTTFRIFRGWHDVKIWRKDVQAICDSMVGFSADSTLHMYIDPVLWYGESQVTADSITAFTRGGSIDRAEFYGDPIMGSELSARKFNQVEGKTMTAFFREGVVYRHDVYGSAKALYYVQEEGDPNPVAFIVASSNNMTFLIEEDFVRYIVAREQVDWPIYPIDQIPNTQPTRLKGFDWKPELKPKLEDVFTRRVRTTERPFYNELPVPEFPIAARILKRREYLINNRMWGDRTDPLPAHAVEFVRGLR